MKEPAGTEVWLGVKLARSRGGVIGWVHSGELQRWVNVGDDSGWEEELVGRDRGGWMVQSPMGRRQWWAEAREGGCWAGINFAS